MAAARHAHPALATSAGICCGKVCVGAAMGVRGSCGVMGSPMAKCSLRVLALVTDAFGGHGGIAQYNQQFLSSLAACTLVGEVIVLPRRSALSPGDLPHRVHQRRTVRGKCAY